MTGNQHTSPPQARAHVNLRLERWHRRSIYLSWAVLAASGAAWLLARYFLRPAGKFGETVHPLEPWAIKLHGAAAMAILFFLGSLMNSHIRRALKSNRNLVTGWSMIVAMAVLVVTAYGLYYAEGEAARQVWSLVHWIAGLGAVALSIAHVLVGRSSRALARH